MNRVNHSSNRIKLSDDASYDALCAAAQPLGQALLRGWFASLRVVMGTTDFEDAVASAIQDALVQAHRHWSAYDSERASLVTWFGTILRRRFLRQAHYWMRHAGWRADYIEVELHAAEDAETAGILTRQAVAEVLEQVTPSQATALRLFYLEGLSMREVAEGLQVTLIAAQSLLQRGRQAFHRFWEAAEKEGAMKS